MTRRTAPLLCLLAAALAAAAATPTARGQDALGKKRPDILLLVARAAADNPAASEEALDALADMGATGMARLRQIEGDTTGYTEAQRRLATIAYNRLTETPPPRVRDAHRDAGKTAFAAADYDLMARKYARLAVIAEADVDDCLWNGHARQLAGKWRSAAAAYRLALERINDMIDNPPKQPNPGVPGNGPNGQPPAPPVWSSDDLNALHAKRAAMALMLGRLLRHECNDPSAAAAVFASATTGLADIDRSIDELLKECVERYSDDPGRRRPYDGNFYYVMQCLLEVPRCKQAAGKPREALIAWNRACAVSMLRGQARRDEPVLAMARLLADLKPDKPAPTSPWLITLEPKAPTTTLKPDEPATRALAYSRGNPDTPSWKFALCPPPGMEFATVTFACDIDQHQVHYGGHFSCEALVGDVGDKLVEIGAVRWTKKKPGREVVTRTFKIPPATRMLAVTTGSWKGYFTVHEVKATATFRPVGKPDPKTAPNTWIQQELLPPGGKCTRNGENFYSTSVASNMAAGRYTYTYAVKGNPKTYRAELDLKPGRRYGLFVNLDSPFSRSLTNLTDLSNGSSVPGDATLAKLPDGRWLVTYCAQGNKIMFATSTDLVTWTKPWPLPANSFFSNVSPAVMVDKDGTITLVYFSNRLNLQSASSGGYRLWMMHSKDARRWSRPRHVDSPVTSEGGWPIGSIQLLRTPNGQCHIFWRHYWASAKNPADIKTLQPINITLPPGSHHIWNPHLAADPDGTMHMVYDNFGRDIFYTRSATGAQWSDPICLIDKTANRSTSHPFIIRQAGRTVLLYNASGTYLRTGSPTDPTKLTPPLKLTTHVAPLNGARPHLTPKGTLILLAGSNTIWTMQAPLSDIFPKTP